MKYIDRLRYVIIILYNPSQKIQPGKKDHGDCPRDHPSKIRVTVNDKFATDDYVEIIATRGDVITSFNPFTLNTSLVKIHLLFVIA